LQNTTQKMEAKPEKKEVKGKMFMHFPGLGGPCRDVGYEGWLAIDSLQWGAGSGVSRGGRRRRRGAEGDQPQEEPKLTISRPSISELTTTAKQDAMMPLLFHSVTNRNIFSECVIVVLSPEGRLQSRWALKEVVISGLSTSGNKKTTSMSLSLNFEELEVTVRSELRRPMSLSSDLLKRAQAKPSHIPAGPIGKIDDHLLTVIFNFLGSKELVQVGLVCHRWAIIASSSAFEKTISHSTSYNIKTHAALLNGENLPSAYVEPEGDNDDW